MPENNYKFYIGRILAAGGLGFRAGHEILSMAVRCAYADTTLTLEETDRILKLSEEVHKYLMEANYNDGWQNH